MLNVRLKLIAVLLTAVCLVSNAKDLASLESLVQQWIALNKTIVNESEKWQEEKTVLSDELKLLEAKNEQLKSSIKNDDSIDDSSNISAQLVKARQRLANIKTKVEETNKLLLVWEKRLPAFMLEPYQNAFKQLKAPLSDKPGALASRFQLQLSLFEQLAQVNQRIYRGTYEIQSDGKSSIMDVIMDVIVFGVSVAFAVDKNGQAASGQFTNDGIKWTFDSSIHSKVAQLIDAYSNPQNAAFISVPVKVDKK